MITSVYQKVLGTGFTELSPVLQEVHGAIVYLQASGSINVVYGKGWLIRLLNRISKMPPEGKDMKLRLEIKRFEDHEIWNRIFNERIFSTDQYAKNGLMLERSGWIGLGFELSTKNGALYFQQKFTKFAGIRVPGIIGLKSIASCIEEKDGWKVSVEVRSPIVGLVLKYNGSVQVVR
jgi:hypothetical protein